MEEHKPDSSANGSAKPRPGSTPADYLGAVVQGAAKGVTDAILSRKPVEVKPDRVIEVDPTKAHLCFFNVKIGAEIPVILDDLPLARLADNTYFQVHVVPGRHRVASERKDALELDCAADGTYYIEFDISFFSNNARPIQATVERFRSKAKKLKPIPEKKFTR